MQNTTDKTNDQQPLNGQVTTMPVAVPPVNPITPRPVWIRLPKNGTPCPFTGLSRSTLNNLILGSNPPVKSVSIRQRHAQRGVRLILLASLLEFIEGVASAHDASNSSAATATLEGEDRINKPDRQRGQVVRKKHI